MSHYSNGKRREYMVRNHLAGHGWVPIMQAAGSKGCADLFMAHPVHGAALIQVGSRSKALGPGDRARFLHACQLAGALPLLAVVIPRAGIRFWHITDAPASRWREWTP